MDGTDVLTIVGCVAVAVATLLPLGAAVHDWAARKWWADGNGNDVGDRPC